MTSIHRYLGLVILVLLVVIIVFAFVLRVTGRDEAPAGLWLLQRWTENLLATQVVLGLVLLVVGRRVLGPPGVWLHYLYGSLFPLIAIIGGRLAALRREKRGYVGLAWGAFFAWALILRAVQTACGGQPGAIVRCFGG